MFKSEEIRERRRKREETLRILESGGEIDCPLCKKGKIKKRTPNAFLCDHCGKGIIFDVKLTKSSGESPRFNRGMNPMNRRSQCCRNDYFFQSSQTYIRSLMNTSQSNSLKAGPEAGAGPAGKEGESYPCGKTELMQQRKMK